MGQWYCSKDNEAMVEEELTMIYMEVTRPILGMKCPKCGAAYLTEQTVEDVVRRGEEALETK